MDRFKNRIQKLISSNKTQMALKALSKRAELLNPQLENEISILSGQYEEYRERMRMKLNPHETLQNALNHIHHSILQLAEILDGPEQIDLDTKDIEARPSRSPWIEYFPINTHKKKLITTFFLFIIVILIFTIWSKILIRNKEKTNCTLVKKEAESTLILLLERKRINKNKYDEIRLLFLEGTLKNHIKLTSCDSVNAILRDIDVTKNYLKSHDQ